MLVLKHLGANAGKEGESFFYLHTLHKDILLPCPNQLIRPPGPYDTFLSGLLGGYLVFGQRSRAGTISSVNQQIVIYVFARVALSLAKLSIQPGANIIHSAKLSDKISYNAWPVFASVSWGLVMWLFRWYPDTLQGSLRSSMNYIYVQADHWDGLRNFLVHNK